MFNFKFQLLSDIHLEFSKTLENLPPIPNVAPYLFLVGDIGYPSKESYSKFLFEQSTRFKAVLVLAGNHEFYNTTYQRGKRDIFNICQQRKNLYFMDKNSLLIDGVRILGTTLWSFVPDEHTRTISMSLNDYFSIYFEESDSPESNKHRLTVAETNAFHSQELTWLKEEIEKASKAEEPVIVLTHHAPSFRNTSNPKHNGSPVSHAFQTDLESMLKKPLLAWCFGHTHYSSDQKINGVRVVSNQVGYLAYEKGTGYSMEKVITADIPQKSNELC